MVAPAPTPFVPESYSTDSADDFAGDPLIEVLHSFYHAGEDDWDTTASYGESIAGLFVTTVVVGLIFLCCIWCFNLSACCKCCREGACKVCFETFNGKQMLGQAVVIILFFVSAIVATCSYAGRNEFNDAAYEAGDEIRSLADAFDSLDGLTDDLAEETAMIGNFTNHTNCDSSSVEQSFQAAYRGLADGLGSVSDTLDGLGDQIRDAADVVEEKMPEAVDLGLIILTAMVWVNALFGTGAIVTAKCKCDDCFAIFLGTLTLVVFIVVVASEVALAVTVADFCYKDPAKSVALALDTGSELLSYYLTCNGTSPLTSAFDEIDDSLVEYRGTARTVRNSPSVSCNDGAITSLIATVNETRATLDAFESQSGCALTNPTFTGITHGIVCDEMVRGLFICFMVHAASGGLLFITYMLFPCAANSKPRFADHKDMARKVSTTMKSKGKNGTGNLVKVQPHNKGASAEGPDESNTEEGEGA